ncbi:MAG: serine/threonine protein kinase [Myxococcota bacterium]|nr:serine/threonine protein kinase [Myxococcota bacterium]
MFPESGERRTLRSRGAPLPLDALGLGCSYTPRDGGYAVNALDGTGQSVSELPPGVREGETIAGKYRIGAVIGSGAMGTVVSAHHLLLDEKVAIKFLLPEALGQAEAVARFLAEARAAVRIGSQHVARVFDVDVLESGAPYIVMEHLEGCDLAEWMRQRGPLPVEQAVDFILQAGDAIAEAHALPRRVIHRDIKPANLFAVQRSGAVQSIKVLDFGVSKTELLLASTLSVEEVRARPVVTQQKAFIGSPAYMSPEQMESAKDVDPRTDIWALGVTLYELLTGRLPFEGTTPVQVYSRIIAEAPLHLRHLSPAIPLGLEAVVAKCLQRHRDNRFATVEQLAVALEPFGSSRATKYAQQIARHAATEKPGGEPSVASPTPRTLVSQVTDKRLSNGSESPIRFRRGAAAAAIALACAALLAAALSSSHGPSARRTFSETPPPGRATATGSVMPAGPPAHTLDGPSVAMTDREVIADSSQSAAHANGAPHKTPSITRPSAPSPAPRSPSASAAPSPSSTEYLPPSSPR